MYLYFNSSHKTCNRICSFLKSFFYIITFWNGCSSLFILIINYINKRKSTYSSCITVWNSMQITISFIIVHHYLILLKYNLENASIFNAPVTRRAHAFSWYLKFKWRKLWQKYLSYVRSQGWGLVDFVLLTK